MLHNDISLEKWIYVFSLYPFKWILEHDIFARNDNSNGAMWRVRKKVTSLIAPYQRFQIGMRGAKEKKEHKYFTSC